MSEKKQPGRPKSNNVGRARTVYLHDETVSMAREAGKGNSSFGIRMALRLVLTRRYRIERVDDGSFLGVFVGATRSEVLTNLAKGCGLEKFSDLKEFGINGMADLHMIDQGWVYLNDAGVSMFRALRSALSREDQASDGL